MLNRCIRNFVRVMSVGSVAAILLSASGAFAQALFQPLGGTGSQSFTLSSAGAAPQGVAVADFNNDGYPDIVVANNTTNRIHVFLASGAGTFNAPTAYSTCSGPTAVLAIDLRLTGLQDIVVVCSASNMIEEFLNLGNGTFKSAVNGTTTIELPTGANPGSIVSGDFNKDGHPDLAVTNSGDGTVTLFLSSAASNFTIPTITTLYGLGTPTAIAAGQFTNSGNLDLAVADSSTQRVYILKGDGTGNFTGVFYSTVQSDSTGIAVGDFNHDGNLDLAVVNAGSGTVSILAGNGNDTFTVTNTITVGAATGTGASYLLALDINGDGNLDLLTGNTLQNTVAVLLGSNNGSFQAVDDYTVPHHPSYLAAGDFNRDGKPDLAVSQSNGASVSVLINNTLPTPERGGLNYDAPRTQVNGAGNMADGVVTADFNHDGNPDIAATYLEDNAVRVVTGQGNGNFNTATVYPVGKQPYWIASGDLNNDGYADLVAVNSTVNSPTGTISVLMNNRNGTFAPAVTYTVGRLPYQAAIGDLNGDGYPDLAVTNYGANTVSILYGSSAGMFTTGPTLPTGANPYGVVIGDFQHNGHPDIAVTCYTPDILYVFPNNGDGTFGTPFMTSTGSGPMSLVTGDFNRDGKLDIVVANATGNSPTGPNAPLPDPTTSGNNISFFAGNGNGTFQPGVISPSLNFPQSIAAGDVNGDGILDIVGVAPNYQQVVVTLGNGDGTFGTFYQRVEFASGKQPWAVALADFNRDGKLDIVTANTVNPVNITIPAYQTMYMNEFPPIPGGAPSLNVLLNISGTTITLAQSPSGTVPYNDPVTLTATVAPTIGSTSPTGTVTFEDTDGTVLGTGAVALSGGTASITIPSLGSGRHEITVLYSGDTLYQPFTADSFVVSVAGTPVSLTLVPNPATVGDTIQYTAVVGTVNSSADPVGTITLFLILFDGTVVPADGPHPVIANGNGTSTFSDTLAAASPGTASIYAVFNRTAGSHANGSSPTVIETVVEP